MILTSTEKPHYLGLTLGDAHLNAQVAPDLKSELVRLVSLGHKNIVVDLQNVDFVDSSGLSAILVGNRITQKANGVFVLTGVQPSVMKILQICQLDSVLNLIHNENEIEDFIIMTNIAHDLLDEEE
ncbi:MAG: STAS domain-containing protein [Bacteroidetes bacterium]|jgi:anti-anti-sigma factor|nr:STAS domain-containing protein [Bacteroidota bacterium]